LGGRETSQQRKESSPRENTLCTKKGNGPPLGGNVGVLNRGEKVWGRGERRGGGNSVEGGEFRKREGRFVLGGKLGGVVTLARGIV